MSNHELWGLWAEEKPPEPEPVALEAEYSIKVEANGYLAGFGLGMPSGKAPAITAFLDSIQAFSRPARSLGKLAGGIGFVIDTEMSIDPAKLEAMNLRILKPRTRELLSLENGSRFMIFDEASSFEDPPKPNWTESRGMKGNRKPKKQNNPKGNKLHGTTWRKT